MTNTLSSTHHSTIHAVTLRRQRRRSICGISWRLRVVNLRARLTTGARILRSRLGRSVDIVLNKLNLTSKEEDDMVSTAVSETRTLRLQLPGGAQRRRNSGTGTHVIEQAPPDGKVKNYTAELVLTGLENGLFSAELPLSDFPKGELTLRVRACKLVVLTRNMAATNGRKTAPEMPVGLVELPIFLDTSTLEFEVSEGGYKGELLLLKGMMKGVLVRHRHSAPCDVQRDRRASTGSLIHISIAKHRKMSSDLELRVKGLDRFRSHST